MVTLEIRPDSPPPGTANTHRRLGRLAVVELVEHGHQHEPDDEQMTRFLSMLFKDLLCFFAAAATVHLTLISRHDIGFRDSPREAPGLRTLTARIRVSNVAILRRTPRHGAP